MYEIPTSSNMAMMTRE